MTTSALRTIIVRRPTYLPRPLRWPTAQPGDDLDYSLDLTQPLCDVGDSIASVSLAVMPSGTGELQPIDLTVNGSVITAQLCGGVAGRDYIVQVKYIGMSGRKDGYLVRLAIDPALASWPPTVAPSAGFGTPITWTSGVTVFGSSFVAVATGLVATGTTQATALPLPAQTNVFGTVAADTGAILPGGAVSGTFVVANDTTTDLFVYPPVGAQIGTLGVNVPAIVSAGTRVNFSTNDASTQWYAA